MRGFCSLYNTTMIFFVNEIVAKNGQDWVVMYITIEDYYQAAWVTADTWP